MDSGGRMATGVACGLQSRRGAPRASRVGSIPTRSRHPLRFSAPARAALLLLLAALWAHGAGPDALSAQEGQETGADTVSSLVTRGPGATADSARGDTLRTEPPISPLGAFARSLVVPGWGQAEVGRPGRGAFYFVAESASLFMALRAQLKLNAARRGAPVDSGLVEARKQQRENWFALAVFWALLSGVDAWVSTHFWEFEGKLEPPDDGSAGVEIRYEVPVGGG